MYPNYELAARYASPSVELTPEREFRHQYRANQARAAVPKAKKQPRQSNDRLSNDILARNLVSIGRYLRLS